MQEDDPHLSDERLVLLGDEDAEGPSREARHFATCSECQQRAEVFSTTLAEVETLYRLDAEAAADLHARTRLALGAEMQRVASGRARPWRRLSDALGSGGWWAAPLAVAVALTLWVAARPAHEVLPHQTREADPRALPIASITPGAVRSVALDTLCSEQPAMPRIPDAMRERVLADYGMLAVPANQYELDYLITPELGGATDRRNLWPQRYGDRRWNALVKDEIEQLLPRLVCSQQVELTVAQRDIAQNWIAAYKKYFRTSEPRVIYPAGARDDDAIGPERGVPAPSLLRLTAVRVARSG